MIADLKVSPWVLDPPEGSCVNERCPCSSFWVLMVLEFLSIGFMASESLCVRFGRIFLKIFMLDVSLLKYDAM